MWDRIKNAFAGAFLVISCGWILLHLILIKIYGTIYVYEPERVILWIEIIFTTALVILGVERFLKSLERRN